MPFLLLLSGGPVGLGEAVDPMSGDGLAESHNDELSVCDFLWELIFPFPFPLLPDLLSLFSVHVGEGEAESCTLGKSDRGRRVLFPFELPFPFPVLGRPPPSFVVFFLELSDDDDFIPS